MQTDPITDANGNPVSGATVVARNGSNVYTATTNSSGVATFASMPNGTYDVYAFKQNGQLLTSQMKRYTQTEGGGGDPPDSASLRLASSSLSSLSPNDDVDTWQDSSGNDRHAVSTGPPHPKYSAPIIGDMGGVAWEVDDGRLISNMPQIEGVTTTFIVCNVGSVSSPKMLLQGGVDAENRAGYYIFLLSNRRVGFGIVRDPDVDEWRTSETIPANSTIVIEVSHNHGIVGVNPQLRVNGEVVSMPLAVNGSGPLIPAAVTRVGNSTSGDVSIYEIIVYQGDSIDPQEIEATRTRLVSEYTT